MAASGFETDEFIVHQIVREEVAEVQAFIESNPEYWLLTQGHRPHADDAAKSFDWAPPPTWVTANISRFWFVTV